MRLIKHLERGNLAKIYFVEVISQNKAGLSSFVRIAEQAMSNL